MKHIPALACLCILIASLTGCGKSSLSKPNGGGGNAPAYFFEDTYWTGVADTYGQTYQQPLCLHFNGDTTVTVYALFAWMIDDNLVYNDSAVGRITNIDTAANGQTTVSVTYPLSNDQQTFSFPDKKTLSGGSVAGTLAPQSAQYSVSLELNPETIPSVSGTSWNTDIIPNSGAAHDMFEFPDISGITFVSESQMGYTRGGKIITYTPPTQDQAVLEGYGQIGPRIYFAGYDEDSDLLIRYFGVLSADGQNILADCRDREHARLPNYTQTNDWYGLPGVTPVTHKVN